MDTDPRAGTVHALQGVLAPERPSVQVQPSGGIADERDLHDEPADLVAGRAMTNCGGAATKDAHSAGTLRPLQLFI
ncbi:hypothetical protein ACVIW0_004743 [Bradyrhizobium sp. USDA 4454]